MKPFLVLLSYQCSEMDEGEAVNEVAEVVTQQLGKQNHGEKEAMGGVR